MAIMTNLRRLTDAIHNIDPAHITMQADTVGNPSLSRYRDFVNSTDGFLPELYPIRDETDKCVPQIVADMKTVPKRSRQGRYKRQDDLGSRAVFRGLGQVAALSDTTRTLGNELSFPYSWPPTVSCGYT